MPILGVIASSISGNLTPPFDASSFDILASVKLTASASSVVFAGIPSGYQNIQIFVNARATSGSQNAGNVRFNNDTTASYSFHQLFGNGSGSGASNGGDNSAFMYFQKVPGSSDASSLFGSAVIDVLDYASSTKNKTMQYIGGDSANGSGFIFLGSNAWYKTEPVTSITLFSDGTSFDTNSRFDLYGIK